MKIYVDTGAFYAITDEADTHHRAAQRFYDTCITRDELVTSSFVLVETWLLIRNKLGYKTAQSFLEGIRRGIIRVEVVGARDLDAAWLVLQKYADQQLTLVDAVSFVVMERLSINNVFTFDHHFRVYRFGAKRERVFTVVP